MTKASTCCANGGWRGKLRWGILPPGVVAHTPRNRDGSWDSLTAEQKRTAARNMEIYAAMVDRLDRNVGRVIARLRASGELDNTVIVFLADNGAEALDVETTGAAMLAQRLEGADNGFANRGAASSYVTYGAGWAQAAAAPSWLTKGYQSRGRYARRCFHQRRRYPAAQWRRYAVPLRRRHRPDPARTRRRRSGGNRGRGPGGAPDHRPLVDGLAAGSGARIYGADDGFGAELFGSRAYRRGRLEAHRHRRRRLAPVRHRARPRRNARSVARRTCKARDAGRSVEPLCARCRRHRSRFDPVSAIDQEGPCAAERIWVA